MPVSIILVDGAERITKKKPIASKNIRNAAIGFGLSALFGFAGAQFQKSKISTESNLFSAATSIYHSVRGNENSPRSSVRVLELIGIRPPITRFDPYRNEFLTSLQLDEKNLSQAEYGFEKPGQAKLTNWLKPGEKFSIFLLRGHHYGNTNGIIALIDNAPLTKAEEFSEVFLPFAAPDLFVVVGTCQGLGGIKDQEAWQLIAQKHLERYPNGSLTVLASTQYLHANPIADFSSTRGKALGLLSPIIMPLRLGIAGIIIGWGDEIPPDQVLPPNLPGNLRAITFKN